MRKTKDFRKNIPLGVRLHACLLLLGFTEEEIQGGIEFDHSPALGLRPIDPVTGEMTPAPNDPRHIFPLRRQDHSVKTRGQGTALSRGDISEIAKTKRLEKQQEEFRSRLLAKSSGDVVVEKPKRKIRSRGFQRRGK